MPGTQWQRHGGLRVFFQSTPPDNARLTTSSDDTKSMPSDSRERCVCCVVSSREWLWPVLGSHHGYVTVGLSSEPWVVWISRIGISQRFAWGNTVSHVVAKVFVGSSYFVLVDRSFDRGRHCSRRVQCRGEVGRERDNPPPSWPTSTPASTPASGAPYTWTHPSPLARTWPRKLPGGCSRHAPWRTTGSAMNIRQVRASAPDFKGSNAYDLHPKEEKPTFIFNQNGPVPCCLLLVLKSYF